MEKNFGLYTDFYELTMAQGFFLCHKTKQRATFDYFFRTNPFRGGFTVFAGLQDFLEMLEKFSFSASDLEFLKEKGLHKDFLQYLENFRFTGNIYSVSEGEIVFPNEPILRVEGNIIECQLIESLLLNILNFESLIATKAFRIKLITGEKPFADFGLRRAQGLGAIHASRAACIGGASSTSNVFAGKQFGIELSGTMAHSWVQSFETELEAYRTYAKANPTSSVLLVDTYNTLKSGVPNAITIAKEMEKAGHQLKAIRLDSGDLAYLSKKARKMLDEAKLEYVKIFASNQLNEYVIKSLLRDQNAAIDAFGIGTEMITGKEDAALDGVYKMAELDGLPKMKISENIEKITLPGKKELMRYFDEDGNFFRDAIVLSDEKDTPTIYHPTHTDKKTILQKQTSEKLTQKVVENGRCMLPQKSPLEIHKYLMKRSSLLPDEHKRFISPHIYKVGISEELLNTRKKLTEQLTNLET